MTALKLMGKKKIQSNLDLSSNIMALKMQNQSAIHYISGVLFITSPFETEAFSICLLLSISAVQMASYKTSAAGKLTTILYK